MRLDDLGQFALTALLRHRLRSSLSFLGVAVGVAAVVMLTGLGEGARRFVIGEFASIGSNLVVLIPGRNETTGAYPGVGGVANDLTLADVRALERGLRQVRRIAPLSMGNETVGAGERSRQAIVLGSTSEFLHVYGMHVRHGRFLPDSDMRRGGQIVVLGARLADELFPGQSAVGRAVRVGDWRMRVIGVLESKGTRIGFALDDLAIVPVATGMRMFNRTSLFRVLIQLASHEDYATACPAALRLLEERHGEDDVTCFTQDSVVESLSSILNVLTLGLAGIAAISLSVAGLGIMNLMLVSVSERTPEIGLLKAVGARDRQVLAVFLAEAILLSTFGGLIGLSFGLLGLRALIWVYPNFPASPPLWAIASSFSLAIVIGAVFGVLPARRATRLDPIAALARR